MSRDDESEPTENEDVLENENLEENPEAPEESSDEIEAPAFARPVVKPTPTLKPAPAAKPAPFAKPAPAAKPAPFAKPAPAAKPAPFAKPAPAAKPAPLAKPAPATKPRESIPAARVDPEGDIVVKDVPVKLTLEKTIISEDFTKPAPGILKKGKMRLVNIILPLIVIGVLLVLAIAFGMFTNPYNAVTDQVDNHARFAAQLEFEFWMAFIPVSYYCMLWIITSIWKAIQQAHKITKITQDEHAKLIKIFFGPQAIIGIVIIAVLIMIYDFNAFGLTVPQLYDIIGGVSPPAPEGWILNRLFGAGSNPVEPTFYVSTAMSVVWLITWWVADFLSAVICWYAIAFMIYARRVVFKFTYRNEPSVVKQLHLFVPEEKAFFEVSFGFIPFLSLKSISQIALIVPWYGDTVVTALTVVLFILIIIVCPRNISKDLKMETVGDETDARVRSILALTDIIEKVEKGEELSLKNAVMALLYSSYLEQVRTFKLSSSSGKKVAGAIAGPGASYGLKAGLGGKLSV